MSLLSLFIRFQIRARAGCRAMGLFSCSQFPTHRTILMKILAALFATVLLAACSSPQSEAAKTAEPAAPVQPAASTEAVPAPAPMADMPAGTSVASASGKVEAVDITAGTVTIAHGPVEALKWPAMTMTFKAGSVDISGLKFNDQVDFEFTSTGMDGTLTKITRE